MVLPVGHEDVAPGIDGNALQSLELAVALAPAPEGAQEGSVRVEDLDPVVPGVRHEDVALFVHCNPPAQRYRVKLCLE